MARIWFTSLLLLLLFGDTVPVYPGAPGDTGPPVTFTPARPGYVYAFPRDHGTHDAFRTEWWYYTGHLIAEDGRRFGFQLTFFRRGIDHEDARANPSQWAIRQLYLAHAAISDPTGRRFDYAEKISRAGLGKAGAEEGRLHVWIDRWSLEALTADGSRQQLTASTKQFELDLTVESEKPVIIHGKDGVSRKGSRGDHASHYYSLTRLATHGTVTVGERRFRVHGLSWMDHEFGSGDLAEGLVGWDWFSVQLEDRSELMLYLLRRESGEIDPVSGGTLVFPDGRSETLDLSDLQVTPVGQWVSPATGTRYPSGWKIAVPGRRLRLELVPVLPDQELVTTRSTQVTYWEGAVDVRGDIGTVHTNGQGYVELTGYAAPFRQRL